MGLGVAVVGAVLGAGYTIVSALLPGGASSNAIFRRASDIIKHDPEVNGTYGEVRTYGSDYGG